MERKRKALSLEVKFDIVNELEKGLKSKSNIAKDFDIPKSTLSGILKKKDEIKEEFQTSSLSPKRKRHRSGTFADVDAALFEWFKDARTSNIPLSGLILQKKANDLAAKLGHNTFSATTGWVDRFKTRHNIVSRAISGESGVVDSDVTDQWKAETLPALLKDFKPKDVFNADETGLFYKMLPTFSLSIRGETCTGGKKGKERLTFLVACNMDGSEKLKLVVIGKYAKPRCFKGVKSLPVTYRANKRAWMTGALFKEWVLQLDKRFNAQKRKVLLIIDNCAAHPRLSGLKAITLAFFPPNTTSVLQPCDQGIIHNLKCKYRQRMVEHIIDAYDKKREPAINVLMAIRYSFAAWEDVSKSLIEKCFRKSGFVTTDSDCDDDDDVPLAQLIEEIEDSIPLARLRVTTKSTVSINEILNIDKQVAVCETRTEEEIVSELVASSVVPSAESEEEEDEEIQTATPIVTKTDALKAVSQLTNFFEGAEDIDDNVFSHLNAIEKNIQSTNQTQKTILHFFKKKIDTVDRE